MNVLFLTLLDFSSTNEQGIYTDLIREFANEGHSIYVISPIEKRRRQKTKLIFDDGIHILKLAIGNVQKTNIVEKGFSTITLESKFIAGIKKYYADVKFDLILYSTPPITLQGAVEYVKNRDQSKTYLLLKDIFPQNAIDLGLLSKHGLKKAIYKYFKHKEHKLYGISDYIGCMSEANVTFLKEHNKTIDPNKIEVCPNTITPQNDMLTYEEKIGLREKYKIPNDKKVFIYGGNLGKPQGIDFLISCIKSNEMRYDTHFLIVGSGTEYSKIQAYFDISKPKNATLLKHIPKQDYERLLSACDCGLIFLDNRFTIPNFPSRLLSYMQANMPVIAATDVNTDIGHIVESGKFGLWCESGDLSQFNKHIEKLKEEAVINDMGSNARHYLETHYTSKHAYAIIIKHFI
jgi:glycosyltransferase involved in cell wall biosynthesis